jgi:3-oxoacyl-[acyl-carrier-protein] synthase II
MTVGEAGVGFIVSRAEVGVAWDFPVEIAGYGLNCNAHHMVEPSRSGVIKAVNDALIQARVTPEEISAVYWHGTGTIQNDLTEAEVARAIFQERSPPCTTTKGTLGHTMGASSGLNMAAACNTLLTGLLPPVGGLQSSAFPWLDLVVDKPRVVKRGPILIVALGFGGINAAIVLSRPR